MAQHKYSFFRNLYLGLLSIFLSAVIIAGSTLFYVILRLPNVNQLKDVHMQVPLRIYTADNKLIGEFGDKRRSPIALSQTPPLLIKAILDTEDQRFYKHSGVDFIGLARAAKAVFLSGKKVQGASTITMQVARNFFLTRKKTYTRKFREILLALKIDHELSKDNILELYINKIYLGQRAYGVAAAAHTYYGKALNQLSVAELAMIAGLPQAPSRDNPVTNPRGAIRRRNHVLTRMYKHGDINTTTYIQATQSPVTASYHEQQITIKAPYVAEMVRTAMLAEFSDNIYDQGYKVYTTINSKLQKFANKSLSNGLIAYSKRHGFIAPTKNLGQPDASNTAIWQQQLEKIPAINGLLPAAVTQINPQSINALLSSGATITINWPQLKWAHPKLSKGMFGATPQQASDIVKLGDIIRVQQINGQWQLSQVPQVNGSLVVLDPNNGAIKALVGGFSYQTNKFNTAIQADRQPGSCFKPFVYSAALAKGYTLASTINDAPVVMQAYGENDLWRPQNATKRFYGPTRLRIGLIKSRNIVSIRLLQAIGIPDTVNYLQRFGFDPKNLPASLSLALGTPTISPVDLAAGYCTFANGGYQIKPFFINKIVNEDGKTVFSAQPLTAASNAPRVITPQNAYLINNVLKDVIRHGTGRQARILRRTDLAGKTGTTNQQMDAWFSGFNSNLVATVWVGFDQPQTLAEYGAQAALPIWIDFMRSALHGTPEQSLPQPPGIVTVRIDPKTGLLAYPGQQNAIFESFRRQYVPTETATNPTPNAEGTNNTQNANAEELF